MSDTETTVPEKPFCVDRAKQGRAACKKCKEKCLAGELRIAKVVPSPYGSGTMKNWHHVNCIFEQFLKQRITTKRIESPDDIDGWDLLSNDDKKIIIDKVNESDKEIEKKHGVNISPKQWDVVSSSPSKKQDKNSSPKKAKLSLINGKATVHRDLLFREFRKLVADISNVSSYTEKTNLVQTMFTKGSDGSSFKGDIILWCKLLLPGVVKRIYNLQSRQLIKLFSKIFHTNQIKMLEDLEQGDIGETIQRFFEESKKVTPISKSTLTVKEVDDFLEELSQLTKEEEQIAHLEKLVTLCTGNDLKVIIRLIKHDLRMNAGAKHILQGIHPDAYEIYQSSRDIDAVITKCLGGSSVKASIKLMTPVLPMLAEPCKSVEQAMLKCPNGMYSEIKYDGERVQVHKKGSEFKYFSRSLKPVLPHKVAHFKDYIPKAFPHGKDLILDSEILMVDTVTGKPLPFGSLGVHKKNEFKDASVCLFVFDCIYFNGESLVHKPIKYRKQILKENMTEITNHIMFSEMEEIDKPEELKSMIVRVLKLGLEGLVLKDRESIYEPGKRHWLKVKKDYLFEGAMADSADLIVLGAWYGTGKKGGMMSVFLMGCYDPDIDKFCTVTKVHTGHDDKTLEQLQSELKMVKISADPSLVPSWLRVTKTMIPDFVAENPRKQPVWEITGAEFTQHDVHTADGISIRFPRVTKIREDKTWKTATTLQELQVLFKKSKENTDYSLLMKDENSSTSIADSSVGESKQKTLFDFAQTPSSSKRSISPSDSPKPKKIKQMEGESNFASGIKNPLPHYFGNVKLLLDENVDKKYSNWLRHFVAYGGKILKPDEWSRATHVLHSSHFVLNPSVECPKTAKHVIGGWLRDSIANKKALDFQPYSVFWEISGPSRS